MPGQPGVEVSNLSFLEYNGYAFVSFVQGYKSNSIDDEGKKTLVLKQDSAYDWKIVSETFAQMPKENKMAFTPSNRFFNR